MVMRVIVMTGPADIGMVILKKRETGPSPSIMAASSTSRGRERKNWRRKKMEKGAMKRAGSIMPCMVLSQPSCLMST